MVQASAIAGPAGYVVEGLCVLGVGVMIGILRALVIESRKGYRRNDLVHRDPDEVGGKR